MRAYFDSGCWRIKFSLERFSAPSRIRLRIQPLESSLGRVPQAPRLSHALLLEMGNQCRKTTRFAHFRGSTLQCLRESACVPSRWKVLSGEFRRRPTALAIKFRKPDRVGRRGLSEPREDFSRLLTYAIRVCFRGCIRGCIRSYFRRVYRNFKLTKAIIVNTTEINQNRTTTCCSFHPPR